MTIDISPLEHQLFAQVAEDTTRRFWGYVEQDDVTQECALWFCIHYAKIQEWRETARTPLAPLAVALFRAAKRYARAEKEAWRRSVPQEFKDDYTTAQVRAALHMALRDPEHDHGSEMIRAVVADLRIAMASLRENDRGVLQAAVDFDYDYAAIAKAYTDDEVQLTEAAAKSRVHRAVVRLTRAMNEEAEQARLNAPITFKDIARYSNSGILAFQMGMGQENNNPGAGDRNG
jgi:DNA-directed RNA polymerase specialized sigma24 family protein